MLVIVGSKKMIEYMVDNIDSKNRMTGLKDKIENKCSKSNWPATFVIPVLSK